MNKYNKERIERLDNVDWENLKQRCVSAINDLKKDYNNELAQNRFNIVIFELHSISFDLIEFPDFNNLQT